MVFFKAEDFDGLDSGKDYLFGGRTFTIYEAGENGVTEVFTSGDDFEALTEYRNVDTKPMRLDGGKAVLRCNFPYDDVTRIESYFLDLYISAHYIPEPSIPGCICYATVVSGTVSMTAQGQTFQLIERGALRFAADQPYSFENMTNATARLVLIYQYLK